MEGLIKWNELQAFPGGFVPNLIERLHTLSFEVTQSITLVEQALLTSVYRDVYESVDCGTQDPTTMSEVVVREVSTPARVTDPQWRSGAHEFCAARETHHDLISS